MQRLIVVLAVGLTVLAGSVSARPLDHARQVATANSIAPVVSPTSALTPAAPGDTTWFGGTVWAADSARWEAVEGGTWTFDTGTASHFNHAVVGGFPKDSTLHAQMEGWVGHLFSPGVTTGFFRRIGESDFGGSPVCVGDLGGLGGDYSLWAGVLPNEADSLNYAAGGPGYGNNWYMSMRKEFFYPGSGTVTLEFDYANDTESGFDHTFVSVDTSGVVDEVALTSYTGAMSGHETLVLQPGTTLPTTAGVIAIRFEVASDAAYSDEDGLSSTTCGAFAVDDIVLSGAIIEGPMTFESDDEGWVATPGAKAPKDWSNIVALADLPPLQALPCNLQDSVLVFENLDSPGPFSTNQSSLVVSPWIDLRRAGLDGRRGKVLELDIYTEIQFDAIVEARFGAQWDPCIEPVTYAMGTGPVTLISNRVAYTATECIRIQVELGHGIPLEAEQVRVAVGLSASCFTTDCLGNRPTPWFDNIRLGVHGDPAPLPLAPESPPGLISSWSTLIPGDASTRPGGVAVDFLGRVYVVDIENDRIQKHTADGVWLTSWGQNGSGPGEFSFLQSSAGAVDVSSDGFVYVADTGNSRVQKFTSEGVYLTEWASSAPYGIAVDDSGFVYVAVTGLGVPIVEKFDPNGAPVGSWTLGPFNEVISAGSRGDIDVAGGLVYTLQMGNFAVPTVAVFTTDGQVADWWGQSDSQSGEGEAASSCAGHFHSGQGASAGAHGLAASGFGEVFVTHDLPLPADDRIEKYTAEGAFLAGWNSSPGAVDPREIRGIALSPSGHRIYVADGREGVVKMYGLSTTAVGDDPRPRRLGIVGAHPNPFSDRSRLVLALPAPEDGGKARYQVDAQVFDIAGRRVRTLHDGPVLPGDATFLWDGLREDGSRAAAGIYFFRVQVDDRPVEAKKIVRLP